MFVYCKHYIDGDYYCFVFFFFWLGPRRIDSDARRFLSFSTLTQAFVTISASVWHLLLSSIPVASRWQNAVNLRMHLRYS